MATRELWKYLTCLLSAVLNFAKSLSFIVCRSLKKKTERSAWCRSRTVLLDVLTCVLKRGERTSLLSV